MSDQEVLHALVCNAYGYDKSIVRALALRVRSMIQPGDGRNDGLLALAERVLDAEEAAGRASRCSDVHGEASR